MTPMTVAQDWDAWAAAWTVLSRLFAQAPDAESLEQIRSGEMLASWPLPNGERAAEGLEQLRASRAQDETIEQVHAAIVRAGHARSA